MHSSRKQLNRLGNLQKLYNTRIIVSEARYLEMKRKRDESAQNLREREATISGLKQERTDLFRYLEKPQIAETPYRVERMHARRYWLEYDLEKDEYYMAMDRQDLEEAESNLLQARHEWMRARKHQDLVDQQYASKLRDVSRSNDRRETEE